MTTPLVDGDDDFSELYDADLPRVDLVGLPAHGSPGFFLMKADASAGLLGADAVRELIEKSETEPGSTGGKQVPVPVQELPNGITLRGSAADMAAFIHGAPVAKAEQSTKSQNDLPDSAFAYIEPGGKKDEDGKTTPRSKRHFPINDEAHVRNALSRASQSPFGDKAMPKIRGAAKKYGIKVSKADAGDALDAATDDGVDGLDPTVPAAEPDGLDDMPGDPTEPGSSAWEAIDSATATKWCMILAGAKRAVCWMKDRELLEAASADPDDAGNACDLATVLDALDYAIGVLAPFAVSEQSESDRLAFEADVAKGAAEPASVLGAAIAVAKAGRVLSSANEQRIRHAAGALNDVLASLPQAPDAGGAAAVTKEEDRVSDTDTAAKDVAKETAAHAPEKPEGQDVAKAEDTSPAEGGEATKAADGDTGNGDVAKSEPAQWRPVYDHQRNFVAVVSSADIVSPDGLAAVAKADSGDDGKPALTVVFDADGNVIGVCDPAAIQPVSGAGKKDPGDAKPDPEPKPNDGSGDSGGADTGDSEDMTPQPSADAGTPADGSQPDDEDENVAKAAKTANGSEEAVAKTGDGGSNPDSMSEVLKSITQLQELFKANETAREETVAKQAAGNAALVEQLEEVRKRLATVEEQPAMPKVFTNGQQPPPGAQLRGQDQGVPQIDVQKALARKQELYSAPDARAQNEIAKSMQGDAIASLQAIHAHGGR